MKQKVVIRAIIKDRQGRTLLLRRRGGRPTIAGKFELPGGKMIAGEQPVDTLRRTLKYHTGLTPGTKQLFDVVSYVDPDDRQVQYLFVVYLVGLPSHNVKITFDSGYDKYTWKKKSDLQQNVVTNSTSALLGLDGKGEGGGNSEKFIIYTDGGSRGNPGPAAAGFVIVDNNGDTIVDGGRFLGTRDSIFAEYAAVLLAMDKAKALGLNNIEFRSDSLSVVNQINGLYRVNDREVMPIYDRIKKLMKEFKTVRIVHIRRDFNQMADGVVNRVLDQSSK
ncbi:hypothetical protein FACS189431_4080 [Alphaproteobacteria bacterium]|nr:hypothetical protein FACS189431_4080 [Alphaproteobacteria bacterium]